MNDPNMTFWKGRQLWVGLIREATCGGSQEARMKATRACFLGSAGVDCPQTSVFLCLLTVMPTEHERGRGQFEGKDEDILKVI
jgi:hypothetical protein